jgi:hypothetical protein
MEDSPASDASLLTPGSASDTESVALPSYVVHATIIFFRSSHQLAKNCIELFTVAALIRMGWPDSCRMCQKRQFPQPRPFFLHRRIFRLSLTLLLDKNKLMLWFRRLRRNSRSKFESSFSKRPSSALGSEEGEPPRFLFVPSPLTEPDFLSDVQVNTPKTPAVHSHTTQALLALRESESAFSKRENHYV